MYHQTLPCPDCDEPFMVPTPQDIRLPSQYVKFICPHCRSKLSATPEQFGSEMNCPKEECGELIHVPDPIWNPMIQDGPE